MKNKVDNDEILKECEEIHFQGSVMKQSPSEEGKEPLWKTIQEQAIDICHVEERYKIYENVEGYGVIHAYMDGVEYGLKLKELEKGDQEELMNELLDVLDDPKGEIRFRTIEILKSKFIITRRD